MQRVMRSQIIAHTKQLIRGPIRFKVGRQVKGKSTTKNTYMMIEFESDQQGESLTKNINKGKIGIFAGAKAYKSGTQTFVQIRKSTR